MKNLPIITTLCVYSFLVVSINGQIKILTDIIQYNIAGLPLVHEVKQFNFDPDVALRRRKQFEELHGVKAEKLIERLGLGIDGYADERLERQRARDAGHLGGVNNFLP